MRSNADRVATFRADLKRWEPKIRGRLDYLVRRTAMLVAQAVIVGNKYGPGTPVDTGFARASWFVSLGSPTRGSAGPTQPAPGSKTPRGAFGEGQGALDAAVGVVAGIKAGGPTVYLLNDAAYIRRLEFGWSQQAPAGMVRVVLAGLQGIVNDVGREMTGGGEASL